MPIVKCSNISPQQNGHEHTCTIPVRGSVVLLYLTATHGDASYVAVDPLVGGRKPAKYHAIPLVCIIVCVETCLSYLYLLNSLSGFRQTIAVACVGKGARVWYSHIVLGGVGGWLCFLVTVFMVHCTALKRLALIRNSEPAKLHSTPQASITHPTRYYSRPVTPWAMCCLLNRAI